MPAFLEHVPALAEVNDGFGYRWHPIYGEWRLHTGQDRGWALGRDVYAARGGIVSFAGWNGGYGNCVIIDHETINGDLHQTLYAHNEEIYAEVGQWLSAGQVHSLMGTTGNSTGIHNHFEFRIGGVPVDPAEYFIDHDAPALAAPTPPPPYIPTAENGDEMYVKGLGQPKVVYAVFTDDAGLPRMRVCGINEAAAAEEIARWCDDPTLTALGKECGYVFGVPNKVVQANIDVEALVNDLKKRGISVVRTPNSAD